MLSILEDASQRPDLFLWFGAIPERELTQWLSLHQFNLPDDVIEFWRATGGGDVFESETLLRPPVPSAPTSTFAAGDEVTFRNGLLVLHKGIFNSAVRVGDGRVVTLTSDGRVDLVFDSFDHWYQQTLRSEFASRYGLR